MPELPAAFTPPKPPGVPLSVDAFAPAFGADPNRRQDASPIEHVQAGLPPFLLLCAEHDLPTLPEGAVEFQRALSARGVEVGLLRIRQRNHNSIMFRAIEPTDPVARVILEFVWRHAS